MARGSPHRCAVERAENWMATGSHLLASSEGSSPRKMTTLLPVPVPPTSSAFFPCRTSDRSASAGRGAMSMLSPASSVADAGRDFKISRQGIHFTPEEVRRDTRADRSVSRCAASRAAADVAPLRPPPQAVDTLAAWPGPRLDGDASVSPAPAPAPAPAIGNRGVSGSELLMPPLAPPVTCDWRLILQRN